MLNYQSQVTAIKDESFSIQLCIRGIFAGPGSVEATCSIVVEPIAQTWHTILHLLQLYMFC